MSRAFDQTMTAFYNVLKRRLGAEIEHEQLMSCAADLCNMGKVAPVVDSATGKVLGYEYSIVTEKL